MTFLEINKIKKIQANPAVTIFLNTHRTFPENVQDSINLRNLIAKAGKRLIGEYGKVVANPIINKLNNFSSEIDHNYNLNSLVIFVSEDYFEFMRLPVIVKDNVLIGQKFATKVLTRSLLNNESYYIICLSRKMIRLIAVLGDDAVTEINDESFPRKNEYYVDADDIRKSWSNIYDNYVREFFNKADKLFITYYTQNPMPVILAGDVRNLSFYKEIADKKNLIIGQIEGNFDDAKTNEIVKHTSAVIDKYISEKKSIALKDLLKAQKEQKILLDINDIFKAAKEGRGLKLLVEKNYFQPFIIENNSVILKDNPAENGVSDDIINDIVDYVIEKNGNVIFFDIDELKDFNRIALISRF